MVCSIKVCVLRSRYLWVCMEVSVPCFFFSCPILERKSVWDTVKQERRVFFSHFENDSIFVPGTVKRMWVWVQTGPISFLNRNWGNDIIYTPPSIKVILSVKRCLFKEDRWYKLNCEEKVFVLSHHT